MFPTTKPHSATQGNWDSVILDSATLPLLNGLANGCNAVNIERKTTLLTTIKISGYATAMFFTGTIFGVCEAGVRLGAALITAPALIVSPSSDLASFSFVCAFTALGNLSLSIASARSAIKFLRAEKVDIADVAKNSSGGIIDLSHKFSSKTV